MTQQQVHRAVARATGEDLATIETFGFSLVDDDPPSEVDVPGQVLEWDALPDGT